MKQYRLHIPLSTRMAAICGLRRMGYPQDRLDYLRLLLFKDSVGWAVELLTAKPVRHEPAHVIEVLTRMHREITDGL